MRQKCWESERKPEHDSSWLNLETTDNVPKPHKPKLNTSDKVSNGKKVQYWSFF